MAKTTIGWLIVYFGGLLLSFVNPLFGALTYLWEYYLRPTLHWWGKDFPDWRWNMLAAVVLVASYLLRRNRLPSLEPVANRPFRWVFGLAGLMLVVSAVVAVDANTSWNRTEDFWKYLVFASLVVAVVRSEKAFDAFAGMHVFGAFYWGYEAYINPQRSAGRLLNVGSADTLSDNLAAAHLLTVLPFVFVFIFLTKDWRLRLLGLVTAPLIVNVFILCNSRGATVGLAAALLVALAISRSRHRVRMVGIGVLCGAMFFALADPEFIERQRTTGDPQDGSAQSRLVAWQGGLDLIRDNPFGVGGGGFHALSPRYVAVAAERETGRMAPHNSWVLVASEWGVVGLGLFVAFIVSTTLTLNRVRKRSSADDDFFYYRAVAVQVGFAGTLVAATFSDRFYGESIYWMAALAVVLERIQYTRLVAAGQAPTLLPPPVEEVPIDADEGGDPAGLPPDAAAAPADAAAPVTA